MRADVIERGIMRRDAVTATVYKDTQSDAYDSTEVCNVLGLFYDSEFKSSIGLARYCILSCTI